MTPDNLSILPYTSRLPLVGLPDHRLATTQGRMNYILTFLHTFSYTSQFITCSDTSDKAAREG
jgi:hypothetical protein